MKNINRYTLLAGVLAVSMLTSCDFEEINTNQLEMTDEEGIRDGFAMGGNVLSLQRTVLPVGTQADDTDVINQYQTSYHLSADCWSGFFSQNNDWGGLSHPNLYLLDGQIKTVYQTAYTAALAPWKKLKEASEKNNTPEIYAFAQILKISSWHKALECFGPMPYIHAADASLTIPFDAEKDVYVEMFKDLTDAINVLTPLAENGTVLMGDYDAVYGGNTQKWVKYANTLLLRLAMRVRFADEALSKQYVTQALKHTIGVMTDKADAAQMSRGAGFIFRNNIHWLSEQYNETRMGSSMFSYLMGYEDPRLAAYFKPVDANCNFGEEAFDGNEYQAVPAGHRKGMNDTYKSFSKPNITEDTPTYWMRASEAYFLRAEAALVWPEFGDAESLYKQGVAMSFEENGVSSSVDSYLNSTKVPTAHQFGGSFGGNFGTPKAVNPKFEGNNEQKLEKIMIQKWIALYPNGLEAWTEWRRTGYPDLNPVQVNSGASNGVTVEKGIRRLIYPTSFYDNDKNKEIYEDAVKKLNGGRDVATTRLWWDCKPGN